MSSNRLSREEKQRRQEIMNQVRAQSGLDREKFYKDGGEASQWRGLHKIERNKKKYTRKVKFK
jgi:hypothetical protein